MPGMQEYKEMKYEVWLACGPTKELQFRFKTREEAEFLLNALKAFRQAEHVEWAINDLEEGCTLQVG